MENNKSKTNLIITISLAILLAVSLLYIVIDKSKASGGANTETSSSVAPAYPSSAKTLAVKEWGIEGKYLGSQPLQYEIKDNTLRFTSENVKSTCGYNYSSFITRYTADQHIDQKGYGVVSASTPYTQSAKDSSLPKVHIGNYYYILTGATAPCIDNPSDSRNAQVKNSEGLQTTVLSAQGDVSNEVHDLFLTLGGK